MDHSPDSTLCLLCSTFGDCREGEPRDGSSFLVRVDGWIRCVFRFTFCFVLLGELGLVFTGLSGVGWCIELQTNKLFFLGSIDGFAGGGGVV